MDLSPFLHAARGAARLAGDMLTKNRESRRDVSFKGEVDLVTNFDRRAQELIVGHLSERFPGHDVLAEEGLEEERGSEFRWIIDPIDGTTNFAHGFPIYAISIALQKNGTVVLGVVHDPTRNEMFSAALGKGAELNGSRIRVSQTRELNRSLLSTGFPYDLRESRENNLDHFADFAVRAQAVRRCGSAALDLSYVACGRFDGFWELKLAPWDVAAGILLVTEAGGRVTDFLGGDPDIFGRQIVASNGHIQEEMLRVLGLRDGSSIREGRASHER